MRKLKLDLANLEVSSFDTHAVAGARGTVQGHKPPPPTFFGNTCDGETCGGGYTCDFATCGETCYGSCNTACISWPYTGCVECAYESMDTCGC